MKGICFCLLLTITLVIDCFAYTPGDLLLKIGNDEILWGQTKNRNALRKENIVSRKDEMCGCYPSYNSLCPINSDGNETCYYMRAGCGAIAMGQVMAMWQFPTQSIYNTYDWSKIPAQLQDGDTDDCPRLIRDIGEAVNMHYQNFAGIHEVVVPLIDIEKEVMTGSWCTMSNILDGFETFGYNAVLEDYDDWKNYGDSWNDLIRSEIECGRPVVMFGKKKTIDIDGQHYFIIDGFSASRDKFHFNWGWKGAENDFYYMSECDYSKGQKLIVGIAPKRTNDPKYNISYKQVNNNVNTCSYSKDSNLRFAVSNVDSYQCSIYDRNGKVCWRSAGVVKNDTANIWNGLSASYLYEDSYYFEVTFKNSKGNSKVVNGSFLYTYSPVFNTIKFDLDQNFKWISSQCEPTWLRYNVENAEIWKFNLYASNGKKLDSYNGRIEDGKALVWNGSSSYNLSYGTDYWYDVEFVDKCGSSLFDEGHRTLFEYDCYTDESLIFSNQNFSLTLYQSGPENYLNAKSIFRQCYIRIYDVKGNFCREYEMIDSEQLLNISFLSKGVYFVEIISDQMRYRTKILLE